MNLETLYCLEYRYTFHTEEKTWNEAQKTCTLNGGNLATITSQEEQNIIMAGVETNKQWWIGVKVKEADRITLYLADGQTSLTWSNWKLGEPNSFSEGDSCVRMRIQDNVWKWSDSFCFRKYGFICRQKYGEIKMF